MHPLNLKVITWSWSLFGGATFVACVVYGLIVPATFHASQLLEQLLPGFRESDGTAAGRTRPAAHHCRGRLACVRSLRAVEEDWHALSKRSALFEYQHQL
jgi:hypothetical protein